MRTLTQNVALLDADGNPMWYGPAYGNADVDDTIASQIGEHAFAPLDERGNVLPSKPAAPASESAAPLPAAFDAMTKDQLLDEVARLRDEGVELDVNSSSRKDDILDAVLAHHLEG